MLAVGAFYTGRTFAQNRKEQDRTFALAREGQITERFTRAVEQLADEKLDIRLGGIYALERIGQDSKTHYEPVMEVLAAFLRENTRWRREKATEKAEETPQEPEQPRGPLRPTADFQAVATVLGRRNRSHERPDYRLNLNRVDLSGANLAEANLTKVDLFQANLIKAEFFQADLTEANLTEANLTEADLSQANLSKADFTQAVLSQATLFDARLTEALLTDADLTEARLWSVDLTGAAATYVHLQRAGLLEANLTKADLTGADLAAADLKSTILQGADLSWVSGLTQEQLDSAVTDENTKLPEYLQDASQGPGGEPNA